MDMLHEAGFPVWLVLALGAWSLAQAWRFRSGKADAVELIGPVVATLIVGALATAWGVQLAFGGLSRVPDPARAPIFGLIGVKEALYNFDFACGLTAVAVLVATTARRRSPATVSSPAVV